MSGHVLELAVRVLAWLSPVLLALGAWYFRPGGRRRLLPPQRRRAVPWGAGEILVAFGLYRYVWPLLAAQALSAFGLFAWLYGPEFLNSVMDAKAADHELNRARLGLWAQAASFPLVVVSIPFLFQLVSGTLPYQLGLTLHRAGRNLLAGVLAWATLTPFVLTLNWLVIWAYQQLLQGTPEEHPLTQLGRASPLPVDWLLLVVATTVAAPVMEELFFRGAVQPWLARRPENGPIGLAAALVIAVVARTQPVHEAWTQFARSGWSAAGFVGVLHGMAPIFFVLVLAPPYFLMGRLRRPRAAQAIYAGALFFAAAHSFAWPTPVGLFVLGLGLGYLFHRMQSLVAPVVLHSLFNSVACALLLLPHLLGPAPAPGENGSAAISAPRRTEPASTSTAVPGSWPPRRTYASAIVPNRGDTTDDVTCPTSLPSRSTRAPAGTGLSPSTRRPSSVRLTWPRSRAMTMGSWPR
jgi:membrane protease YdiL (CAAX protease family)